MLTLKKVKEMVKAPIHTKRVPSPKVLLEDGRILLRKEFEHDSHLTLYHSGYVWFSTGKRNTVFHIHDCCGDYAYGASKGKGEVIKEEYFENCEWHIEEVMDSIHCARQKAVKLLDELEREFQLIERRRQGLGKPNLLYVKDLYAGLSQSNYWKYENHTSGGLKTELPGVPKSNGSNTEKINKTDNSETDLIYPAELQEEEQYRRYFKEALELEILEQGYPADKAVLYEILELLVETVTSRKKFLRICGEEKPKEVVKSRLMKLDSSHIAKEYGCGAKVFNRLLHLHGIQYLANGQWVLYSEHHGKGYTSSLTFRLQRSDGSEVEKLHTAWTQKGRKFLYHTLKRRGVLPLAEQGG